jgi:hypothetical protein
MGRLFEADKKERQLWAVYTLEVCSGAHRVSSLCLRVERLWSIRDKREMSDGPVEAVALDAKPVVVMLKQAYTTGVLLGGSVETVLTTMFSRRWSGWL